MGRVKRLRRWSSDDHKAVRAALRRFGLTQLGQVMADLRLPQPVADRKAWVRSVREWQSRAQEAEDWIFDQDYSEDVEQPGTLRWWCDLAGVQVYQVREVAARIIDSRREAEELLALEREEVGEMSV